MTSSVNMATPAPEPFSQDALPPAPKAPWSRRLFALFTREKIPGWVMILWTVVLAVPDWKGRIDFWLEAAKATSGYSGEAAAIISSPYFSITLAVMGVLWIAFVGGPR